MRKNKLHNKVDELKELLAADTSISDIASKFGCTWRTVKRVIEKNGMIYINNHKRKPGIAQKYESYDDAVNRGCTDKRTIKKFLLIERGYKCEGCNNVEWRGIPITLELHHIDGNGKNVLRENCELLCPNCHEQTDNYRFKGKQHI